MNKYEFGVMQLLGNYFVTYSDDGISSYPVTIGFMQKYFKKDYNCLVKIFGTKQMFIYKDEKIAKDKVKKILALEFLNKMHDF